MGNPQHEKRKSDGDFLTAGVLRTLENMTTYVVVRMRLPESSREDVRQDLVMAAVKARDNFHGGGADAWDKFAGTVIRNAAKDLLPDFFREAAHRAEPTPPAADGDAEEEGREPVETDPADPSANVHREIDRIELRECVAALEPKLRDAALLLMDGVALRDIAGRIGVARSTLYRYILPGLRKALADFEGAL